MSFPEIEKLEFKKGQESAKKFRRGILLQAPLPRCFLWELG